MSYLYYLQNILTVRLTKCVYFNGFIGTSQAGFRKEYSPTDHIISLQALVQKYLNIVELYIYGI